MRKSMLAAAVLLVPAALSAQSPAASEPGAAAQAVTRAALVKDLDASFARIDANRDGVITVPEADASQERARQQNIALLLQRAEQQFTQLDSDKNGQISRAEFKALAGAAKVVPGKTAIDALDANKDQKLTVQEFRAKRLAQFDALDSNRDGTVTKAELARKR